MIKVEQGDNKVAVVDENDGSLDFLTTSLSQLSQLEKDEFSLAMSQNDPLRNIVQGLLDRSVKMNNCVKNIHFMMNSTSRRGARVPLFLYTAATNATGQIEVTGGHRTVSDIIDCQFLVIGTAGVDYDPNQVTILTSVQISIKGARELKPANLQFASGSVYGLSDGYSIAYCKKIGTTEILTCAP